MARGPERAPNSRRSRNRSASDGRGRCDTWSGRLRANGITSERAARSAAGSGSVSSNMCGGRISGTPPTRVETTCTEGSAAEVRSRGGNAAPTARR
eukprot:3729179-Prymnesium_polylepis.2